MSRLDLAEPYPGTDISNAEVYALGAAVLDVVGAVIHLGHVSPGSTLDYWGQIKSTPEAIARDFVAWTAGRNGAAPEGAADRLRQVVEESGWLRAQVVQRIPIDAGFPPR